MRLSSQAPERREALGSRVKIEEVRDAALIAANPYRPISVETGRAPIIHTRLLFAIGTARSSSVGQSATLRVGPSIGEENQP